MGTQKTYKATVPSNIAFLKYWGKKDQEFNWPFNDSLSMSLKDLVTITTATLSESSDFEFCFSGVIRSRSDQTAKKAFSHLDYLAKRFDLKKKLRIVSENSFPTACGIASSASGMGALTIAALAAWHGAASFKELEENGFDLETLIELARVGSGSACRSLMGGFVVWEAGSTANDQRVSQLYDERHWPLKDVVVILSQQPKPVASSKGHLGVATSPLFKPRLAGIPERKALMKEALKAKDISKLGLLIEQEALEMHSVMMTQDPPCDYFIPATSQFLGFIRYLRQNQGINSYFTLDAGPNVHLICEADSLDKLYKELERLDIVKDIISSSIGGGPKISCF